MAGWKYDRTLDEFFFVFLKYNYVFSSRVMTPVLFGRERRRVSQMLFFCPIASPVLGGSGPSLCLAYNRVVG